MTVKLSLSFCHVKGNILRTSRIIYTRMYHQIMYGNWFLPSSFCVIYHCSNLMARKWLE